MIPESYEQWVHCIKVKCGIPLTREYAARRLSQLRDADDDRTKKFRDLYGDEYLQRVISWFERCLKDAAN
jgi:hypothetical protein